MVVVDVISVEHAKVVGINIGLLLSSGPIVRSLRGRLPEGLMTGGTFRYGGGSDLESLRGGIAYDEGISMSSVQTNMSIFSID